MPLARYDHFELVRAPLGPLTAALAWLRGLRSVGFVADVLAEKHSFSGQRKTREAAKAIASHAELGVSLLEQALGGPAHTGYIAAYYGLLDLAKVITICAGKLDRLKQEKLHGVSWSGINTKAQDMLTDHVTLRSKGAIALLYEAITGNAWPVRANGRRISLKDVYPFIQCVSAEYSHIYRLKSRLGPVVADYDPVDGTHCRGKITFLSDPSPRTEPRRTFKVLDGLQQLSDIEYATPTVEGSADETPSSVGGALRHRYLLYYRSYGAPLGTFAVFNGFHAPRPEVQFHGFTTPVSASPLLLPEELPLLLAFFHLGNVVRYDPVRLSRLRDSPASILVDTLLPEGTFAFVGLVISYIYQTQYVWH